MGEILRNLHIQLVKIGVQLNYYTAYSGKIEICMRQAPFCPNSDLIDVLKILFLLQVVPTFVKKYLAIYVFNIKKWLKSNIISLFLAK